ncbi:tyrosine-protein kinase receptor torso-like [Sabethes cyaneus]|uniref:tyrosine-protein kinase receptor torso-like n=1 Tax=Sabethes cyaneus TaxID=53552 RepID=UPI00237EA01C|nr:tyrosine-protein kinase receptor torso-like [Sabethes cyaneus]
MSTACAKCLQLVLIAQLLFIVITGEKVLLHDGLEYGKLLETGSCVSKCLKETNGSLQLCYDTCSQDLQDGESIIEQDTVSKFQVKLICRDSTSLVIKIHKVPISADLNSDVQARIQRNVAVISNGNESKKALAFPIYLLNIESSDHHQHKSVVYMASESMVTIDSLSPNCSYNISLTVISENRFSSASVRHQITTLPLQYKPQPISSVDVIRYRSNSQDSSLVDAIISWKPASEMTCHYEILHYSTHLVDADLTSKIVEGPEELYHYVVDALELNSEYEIAVRAQNTRFSNLESELIWHTFYTPSCAEWHNNSQFCAPEMVENIQVDCTHLFENTFTFDITWNKPRFIPEFYSIKLLDLDPEVVDELHINFASSNVSGNETGYSIESFSVLGAQYGVVVTAHANNRTAERSVIKPLYTSRVHSVQQDWERAAVIILALVVIGVFVVFVYYALQSKVKQFEKGVEFHKNTDAVKEPVDTRTDGREILQSLAPIQDEMEVDLERIQLLDVLGEGAFGLVRQGILVHPTGDHIDVAVKMLKEFPSLGDIKEFRREIEVMKSVGNHPNVVSILGHYTQSVEDMMLLTEYCSEGNLLDYLRCEWNKLLKLKSSGVKCTTPALQNNKKPESVFNFDVSFVNEKKIFSQKFISVDQSGTGYENQLGTFYENQLQSVVENQCYYSDGIPDQKQEKPEISCDQLIDFARQIAVGMEFLALNKVVHRDLAARNVLVCKNNVVKISDFGLSRDIYQENVYKKTGDGKLPVKWLALESLTHQVYTSQSDVWSFGILLYEICTLGGNPYPSIATNRLILELKTGYRMEKPSSCSPHLYDLMLACWSGLPNDRPSFSAILGHLDKLAEHCKDSEESLINLEAIIDPATIQNALFF